MSDGHRPEGTADGAGAGADEAAALAAAIEQFRRDTAPPSPKPAPVAAVPSAWQRAALAEGVRRQPETQPAWD